MLSTITLALLLAKSPSLVQKKPNLVPQLKTRWTDRVSKTQPHAEYPRPQMVRANWVNLNGPWDFGFGAEPDFTQKILVPFPVESFLSGVARRVGPSDHLWYRRRFNRPKGDRVLLHFGASDFQTDVVVNGQAVGSHKGGYDGFTFDITDKLNVHGTQELYVHVTDPTDAGTQPRGKQVRKPGGIFYTSTSGIWQTVWLEGVPETHIDALRIDTWPKSGQVGVGLTVSGPKNSVTYSVEVLEGESVVARSTGTSLPALSIKVPSPRLWSPESPFLYGLRVKLIDFRGSTIDTVTSYFGMRDVSVQKDEMGITRIFLNGKPYFMNGPLDQGFWPDGLYTAPTDEALKYDIEVTKSLGFNMIRKHVKVEPDRWYYWCDKLGVLVWQDMPSGDGFIGPNDPDLVRIPESVKQYETEIKAMIDGRRNHPCIVTWIPFNEGWGQFETERITTLVKAYDPSRLVDSTTGWADRKVGDMIDWHVYPGPGSPRPEDARAAVLGEFGGLGLPIKDHTWQKEGWGYRSFKTQEELTVEGVRLFEKLHFLIGDPGLSAAVYTQTSDVETEVNGLMTYDREIIKMDAKQLGEAIRQLYGPAPILREVVPTSQEVPQQWHMTTNKPADVWMEPTYKDADWSLATGGFGTAGTPGAIVHTTWTSDDIWIRRKVTLPKLPRGKRAFLNLHHDDDVEAYLDGKLILKLNGYTTEYGLFRIPQDLIDNLSAGEHVLAIHCHQISGGQFVDAGIKFEH